MADYIGVAVAAVNLVPVAELGVLDQGVPGVYVMMLPKGLPIATLASAALDVFHSNLPVDNLDDMEFFAFDPETGLVLEEGDDHESYSLSNLGRDFERSSDDILGQYPVKVEALNPDKTVAKESTLVVAACAPWHAIELARALQWKEEFTLQGLQPRIEVFQFEVDATALPREGH